MLRSQPYKHSLVSHFKWILCVLCTQCFLTSSCVKNPNAIEPKISIAIPQSNVAKLPSPYPELGTEEKSSDWGRELALGTAFAKEGDYYRAITCFKKARFLTQSTMVNEKRREQIEYNIFTSYFLGRRYEQAIETYEGSPLESMSPQAKAYIQVHNNLLECYLAEKKYAQVQFLTQELAKHNQTVAQKMALFSTLMTAHGQETGAQSPALTTKNELQPPLKQEFDSFLLNFDRYKKSVRKAEFLNAVLPGAGYLYVGQMQSGVTSFVLNALFIAATCQFFSHGQQAAGVIAAGLEVGWYMGGIRGAGLAAKQYNDLLWSELARNTLSSTRSSPILILEYGF